MTPPAPQPRRWPESVLVALIAMIGVVVVAVVPAGVTIYTDLRAKERDAVADKKLDSIHTATNSALTAANEGREAALKRIAALEELLRQMATEKKP